MADSQNTNQASQQNRYKTILPQDALARHPVTLPNPHQAPTTPTNPKPGLAPIIIEIFRRTLDAGPANAPTNTNPVTNQPFRTSDERRFVNFLNDDQRNGLRSTQVKDELSEVRNAPIQI
jgi:hypothetical protein